MSEVEAKIHAPRVSADILAQRLEYTRNFPDYEVRMSELAFPTMRWAVEAVSLVRDLKDARDELRALAEMTIENSCSAKGHIPPEVELAFDILMRYDWGERVGA